MKPAEQEVKDMPITWCFDPANVIGRMSLFSHGVEAAIRKGENLSFGATLREVPPSLMRGSSKKIIGVSLYVPQAVSKTEERSPKEELRQALDRYFNANEGANNLLAMALRTGLGESDG